jgi:hypothetical protein
MVTRNVPSSLPSEKEVAMTCPPFATLENRPRIFAAVSSVKVSEELRHRQSSL